MSEAAVACRPNINAQGRARRRSLAWIASVFALVMLAIFVDVGAAGAVRTLVALPAMVAAAGFLQARRNTCVALAATGQREGDSGLERVTSEESVASRRVAGTILRDTVLVGAVAAAIGVASVLIR